MRFLYKDISFEENSKENSLVVTGEITNESGKDFNAVVFQIVLFIKSECIGRLTITMNGFRNGQTRTFKESVGELGLSSIAKRIPEIKYEIYPESSY